MTAGRILRPVRHIPGSHHQGSKTQQKHDPPYQGSGHQEPDSNNGNSIRNRGMRVRLAEQPTR
jgi:hypothetical protein